MKTLFEGGTISQSGVTTDYVQGLYVLLFVFTSDIELEINSLSRVAKIEECFEIFDGEVWQNYNQYSSIIKCPDKTTRYLLSTGSDFNNMRVKFKVYCTEEVNLKILFFE